MNLPYSVYSFIQVRLYFHLWAIVKNAAMGIPISELNCFQFFWLYNQKYHIIIPFLIFQNHHTIFHSDYTILHFSEQCTKFPISQPSSSILVIFCLIWFRFCFLFFFDNSHPNGCEVVSYCGFDLHLPND